MAQWGSGTYSQERIDRFRNPALQVSEIDAFVEDYKRYACDWDDACNTSLSRAAKDGNRKESGFPESAYRISKAAEIALTLVQARELKSKNIIVNAVCFWRTQPNTAPFYLQCCPGFVDTDMTSHKGHLTLDQGADTPIYLATDPNVPHGEFVYKRKPKDWLTESPNFD